MIFKTFKLFSLRDEDQVDSSDEVGNALQPSSPKGSEHSWTLQGAKTIGQHSKTMNKLPPSKIMQQNPPEIKRTW